MAESNNLHILKTWKISRLLTIDLIVTNRPRSFCNSDSLETGLSDFHKLIVTVLKTFFKKQSSKIISYRNYKNFSNDLFRTDLIKWLIKAMAF